jgi:hypothetical protein
MAWDVLVPFWTWECWVNEAYNEYMSIPKALFHLLTWACCVHIDILEPARRRLFFDWLFHVLSMNKTSSTPLQLGSNKKLLRRASFHPFFKVLLAVVLCSRCNCIVVITRRRLYDIAGQLYRRADRWRHFSPTLRKLLNGNDVHVRERPGYSFLPVTDGLEASIWLTAHLSFDWQLVSHLAARPSLLYFACSRRLFRFVYRCPSTDRPSALMSLLVRALHKNRAGNPWHRCSVVGRRGWS